MKSPDNRLSPLVESQLPGFVQDNYTTFIEFLETYYEWMEEEQALEYLLNHFSYIDIEKTPPHFLKHFFKAYLANFPKTTSLNNRYLIKNIKDFYESRGSESSYNFLFHVLYDIEASIFHNAEVIYDYSSHLYVDQHVMWINGGSDSSWFDAVGEIITGEDNGGTAKIEKVYQFYYSGDLVTQLWVSNVQGTFDQNEEITTSSSSLTGYVGVVMHTLEADPVGQNYEVGDWIYGGFVVPSTPDGVVTSVDSRGGITGISVNPIYYEGSDGGPSYSPLIYNIQSDGGSGATIEATHSTVYRIYQPYYRELYSDTPQNENSKHTIDDDRYNSYVYEIQYPYRPASSGVNISPKDYLNIVKKTVHPAGMKMMGNLQADFESSGPGSQTNSSSVLQWLASSSSSA